MENQLPEKRNQTEEVDLGQLFYFIGKGFFNLFKAFLKFYLYIRRNAIKFGILIIAGLLTGFGLNQIITKRLKMEVIVKPNLESKAYLYDVVEEISANVKAKDTSFFNKLNIDINYLNGFEIQIEPIEEEGVEDLNDEVKYLELLEKFRDEEGVLDVVRSEIRKKSTLNHRITFFFKQYEEGRAIASKLIGYINSNEFYNELRDIHIQNAQERIQKNEILIAQIDRVVAGYTNELASEDPVSGTLVLSDGEPLNVTNILRLKNEIIEDTELKKLEIQGNKEAIRIISFGNTQEVRSSFFGKTIIFIPILLVVLFLLIDFSKYLNKKATELQLK